MIEHSQFGKITAPGTVRWYTEGGATTHFTSLGLRRKSPPDLSKPSILALGDSFTEALMISDEDVYTTQLEMQLHKTGLDYNVLNAGRSSASIADYIYHAPWYRKTFAPRWVLIQVRDDDFGKDAWNGGIGKAKFSYLDDKQSITVVSPPLRHYSRLYYALDFLRQHSALATYGYKRLQLFQQMMANEPPLFRATLALRRKTESSLKYPIEQELKMLVRSYEQRVTLVYLASYDPKAPEQKTEIEEEVSRICSLNHWSFVNLRTTYSNFTKHGLSPYGFLNTAFNQGHMNSEGHHTTVKLIVDELKRLHSNVIF